MAEVYGGGESCVPPSAQEAEEDLTFYCIKPLLQNSFCQVCATGV